MGGEIRYLHGKEYISREAPGMGAFFMAYIPIELIPPVDQRTEHCIVPHRFHRGRN